MIPLPKKVAKERLVLHAPRTSPAFATLADMIVATLLALSLSTCPHEPPQHDSTFTVTCSVNGSRHEIYGWCPSRLVYFHRVRKLTIVRDQFGIVQEVAEEYRETPSGETWKRTHFHKDRQRLAVREFIRWSCLTDSMIEYHRGDEVRRIALSKLLNPDAMIGDEWFLRDESEWRTHTVYEAVVVPD